MSSEAKHSKYPYGAFIAGKCLIFEKNRQLTALEVQQVDEFIELVLKLERLNRL